MNTMTSIHTGITQPATAVSAFGPAFGTSFCASDVAAPVRYRRMDALVFKGAVPGLPTWSPPI